MKKIYNKPETIVVTVKAQIIAISNPNPQAMSEGYDSSSESLAPRSTLWGD